MKKIMIDSDMPMGRLVRVKDFLPSPDELAVSEATTKITISLNKSSVEFFKQQAQLHRTKYQRMIRELVDRYATRYSKSA
ncbi:CopG family transcriptional regulator [bacterium]|nr:MAG: CopG family transcriptional regulator [bacterium]